MIRDHKNTIYRMLSFIINTFQELPKILFGLQEFQGKPDTMQEH